MLQMTRELGALLKLRGGFHVGDCVRWTGRYGNSFEVILEAVERVGDDDVYWLVRAPWAGGGTTILRESAFQLIHP